MRPERDRFFSGYRLHVECNARGIARANHSIEHSQVTYGRTSQRTEAPLANSQ
jgi:hypothetical protein